MKFCASHHQHVPGFFDISVSDSRRTKHLHATAFEVVQILGVVDAALAIDFVVMDAKGDLVFCKEHWKGLGGKLEAKRFGEKWRMSGIAGVE